MGLYKQKKYDEIKIEKTNTSNVEDTDSLTTQTIIFASSDQRNSFIRWSNIHASSSVMPRAARLDLYVLKRMYTLHGVPIVHTIYGMIDYYQIER